MKEFINAIVVDASGSMMNKADAVRRGLTELFGSIKNKAKNEKKVRFKTIVLNFSDHDDMYVQVNSDDPKDLSKSLAKNYRTRGLTALYDAIGKAFSLVDDDAKNVYFNILTDGMENNSVEYTFDNVKSLIKGAKEKGWAITFMGTTEEAINTANDFGVSKGNTMVFENSEQGVMRSMYSMQTVSDRYFESKIADEDIDLDKLIDNKE